MVTKVVTKGAVIMRHVGGGGVGVGWDGMGVNRWERGEGVRVRAIEGRWVEVGGGLGRRWLVRVDECVCV